MTYKDRLGEVASAYWHARQAGDEDLARMIWDAFDCVEPDPAPPIPCLQRIGWSNYPMPSGRLLYSAAGIVGGNGEGGAEWLGLDRTLSKHGFVEIEEWEDGPFRAVWILDTDTIGAVVTYCEGDFSCVVFYLDRPGERSAFCTEIAEADAFYRREVA